MRDFKRSQKRTERSEESQELVLDDDDNVKMKGMFSVRHHR